MLDEMNNAFFIYIDSNYLSYDVVCLFMQMIFSVLIYKCFISKQYLQHCVVSYIILAIFYGELKVSAEYIVIS